MKTAQKLIVTTLFALAITMPTATYAYDSGAKAYNSVTPLIDGTAIFNEVDSMINSATKAIHVEMYEFQQTSIADKLIAKKKAGLEVQVILDPASKTIGDYLSTNGVSVYYYPQSTSSYIDHVKLLTIDGNQALMGGMNWGTNSPNHHDADLFIKGPNANDLNTIFTQDWSYVGGGASYSTTTQATVTGTTS